MTKFKSKPAKAESSSANVRQDTDVPVGLGDAVRPLSVGLFLAIFLPVSSAVGGALLYLLSQTYQLDSHLKIIEERVTRTGDEVGTMVKGLNEVQQKLPELQATIAAIRATQLAQPKSVGAAP